MYKLITLLCLPFWGIAQTPIALIKGVKPIEYSIRNTEVFDFKLNTIKDSVYMIEVLQKGIDLVITLKERDGQLITKQDAPNGAWGAEKIEYVATHSKELILEVKPLNEDTLIKKGRFKISYNFKKKTEAQNPYLSPKQLQKDLKVFRQIRVQANSGFYRYRTKQQMDSLYAWASNQVKSQKTVLDFYKIILTLTDFEGSCHNNTDLPHELSDYFGKDKGYFPFFMKWIEGKMVVNSLHHEIPIGAEIKSINGKSANELMESFYKYYTTDGYNETQKQTRSVENSFGRRYLLEYGVKDSFVIHYVKPNSQKVETSTLKSISYKERLALRAYSEPFDSTLNHEKQAKYSFKRLHETTGLLNIRSFAIGGNEKDEEHLQYVKFLDSLFLNLKKAHFQNLILDIRDNPGGTDSNHSKTFTYLSSKPFRDHKAAFVNFIKVPLSNYLVYSCEDKEIQAEELKNFEIENLHGLGYTIQKGTVYFQKEQANPYFHPDKNAFEGRIYVLINENVASAASNFASLVRGNTNAIFIGTETTGGYYGHNGHTPIEYVLPNSQIKTRFSIVHVNQDVPPKKSQPFGRGILPDYEVAQTFDDFIKNEDTQMNFVLKLIEAKK